MSEDFDPIEQLAGNLLQSLSAPERRYLLRKMARALRATSRSGSAASKIPTARPMPPAVPAGAEARQFRREIPVPQGRCQCAPGLHEIMGATGAAPDGFDAEAGAIRSFFWDKVERFLPVEPEDQNKAAGKLRRRGNIRRQAMFRKLRSGRFLRSGATDSEAWIGFTGARR